MLKYRFPVLASLAFLTITLPLSRSGHALPKKPVQPARFSMFAIQETAAPDPKNAPANQLPPGDGRDVAVRLCSQCHAVSTFAQRRYTKDHWDTVLDDMISKGLNAADDDMDKVEKYLSTYMTPSAESKGTEDGKGSSDKSAAPKSN